MEPIPNVFSRFPPQSRFKMRQSVTGTPPGGQLSIVSLAVVCYKSLILNLNIVRL